MDGKSTACSVSGRIRLVRRFEEFVELQCALYGVRLEVPSLPDQPDQYCASLKKFCSGLLEGCRNHPWRSKLRRLPARSRWSIAMSLFLFRKVIPSPEPSTADYLEKMSTPGPEADEDFLRFCRREVSRMFRPGWDAGFYENCCLRATVPVKSCIQRSMSHGGSRAHWLERGHHDYVLSVLALESSPQLCASRVTPVYTGGKWRLVSVGDADLNLLRPLHSALYNHISRYDWLLRGDAKATRFKDFVRKEGEFFCSGDYESATDNLNANVQRCILESILNNSTSIPKGIRDLALQSQELELYARGCPKVTQRRGQLMGNLLSFPLLCIVNYLGFRYFVGEHPVKINGDDIVFRAPMWKISRWMEGVGAAGLTLSKGKTLVDSRFFSLNSRLFEARGKKVSQVPIVRSTALGMRQDRYRLSSMAGRFYSCADGPWSRKRLTLIRTWFLKFNRQDILRSRRSVTRGLGLRARYEELVAAGLWARERAYLSFPAGVETPLPTPPAVLEQLRVPTGWSLRSAASVPRRIRRECREMIGPAFVECAWSDAALSTRDHFDEVGQVNFSFGLSEPRRLGKFSRLLQISKSEVARKIASYRPSITIPSVPRKIWCPDTARYLTLVSAGGQKWELPLGPRMLEKSAEDRHIFDPSLCRVFSADYCHRVFSKVVPSLLRPDATPNYK